MALNDLNGVHVGACNSIALMNLKYDNEPFECSAFAERETPSTTRSMNPCGSLMHKSKLAEVLIIWLHLCLYWYNRRVNMMRKQQTTISTTVCACVFWNAFVTKSNDCGILSHRNNASTNVNWKESVKANNMIKYRFVWRKFWKKSLTDVTESGACVCGCSNAKQMEQILIYLYH